MGAQRGQMKEILSGLVRWTCSARTRDFFSALAALVGQVQIFVSSPFTISSWAQWAGSRAGSPVS
jgi:hypothetical protein